jgi:uncharacterized protein (TIGR00251 family)
MAPAGFWQWRGTTLLLRCQVQPGAAQDRIIGEHGGRLRVRVCAPPSDGAANQRLCRLLATAFGVAVARVTLESGASSRLKTLAVHEPARLPGELGIGAGA